MNPRLAAIVALFILVVLTACEAPTTACTDGGLYRDRATGGVTTGSGCP